MNRRSRNIQVLRALVAGSAATIVATVGIFASEGCGSSSGDMSFASAVPGPGDGGTAPTSTTGDAGSTPSTDAGTRVSPPVFAVVHAAPNLYDFRLCAAIGASSTDATWLTEKPFPSDPNSPMPRTNYVGVPHGGSVVLPVNRASQGTLELYVVDAYLLAKDASATCESVTCGRSETCPTKGRLFQKLNDTLLMPSDGRTTLFVVTGCLSTDLGGGAVVSPEECGAGYDGTRSNVKVQAISFDSPFVVGDASTALGFANFAAAAGKVSAWLGPLVNDAGAPLLAGGDFLSVGAATTVAVPSGDPGAYATSGVFVAYAGSAGYSDGGTAAFSLAAIEQLSRPEMTPNELFAGKRVVLALVGDPRHPYDPRASVDGGDTRRALRVVAIPADPPANDAGADAGGNESDAAESDGGG